MESFHTEATRIRDSNQVFLDFKLIFRRPLRADGARAVRAGVAGQDVLRLQNGLPGILRAPEGRQGTK